MGLLPYNTYNIGILSHNQKYLPHNTEITTKIYMRVRKKSSQLQ